jgi:hypothetical protein
MDRSHPFRALSPEAFRPPCGAESRQADPIAGDGSESRESIDVRSIASCTTVPGLSFSGPRFCRRPCGRRRRVMIAWAAGQENTWQRIFVSPTPMVVRAS